MLFYAFKMAVSMRQSYEIKLPSQAFLDGRSSPWRKLRQVECYDAAKLRLVTIDSCAQLSTIYKSELCYIIKLNLS